MAHALTPQLVCGNVSPVRPALSSITEAGITLVLHYSWLLYSWLPHSSWDQEGTMPIVEL